MIYVLVLFQLVNAKWKKWRNMQRRPHSFLNRELCIKVRREIYLQLANIKPENRETTKYKQNYFLGIFLWAVQVQRDGARARSIPPGKFTLSGCQPERDGIIFNLYFTYLFDEAAYAAAVPGRKLYCYWQHVAFSAHTQHPPPKEATYIKHSNYILTKVRLIHQQRDGSTQLIHQQD